MKRALIALCLGLLSPAFAQAQTQKTRPVPQPVQRYDFENDQVVGTLVQPDDLAVTARGKAGHRSLVQPRQSFLNEMIKSTRQM